MSLILLESFSDSLQTQRRMSMWELWNYYTFGRTNGSVRVNDGNRWYRWYLPPARQHASMTMGVAIYDHFNLNYAFGFGEGFTTQSHIRVGYSYQTGQVRVLRGDGTVLGTTEPNVVFRGVWHYVELSATIHDTTGSVALRVDGKVPPGWTDLTNIDTRNGGASGIIDTIHIGFDGQGGAGYFCDLYVVSTDGTNPQGIQGDTRVYALRPTGNGNYSQLVGQDADSIDNYLNVDEAAVADPDADYNGSPTTGDKDTYVFGDLPVATGSIVGVTPVLWASKSEAGTKAIRAVMRRNSVDAVGADHTLTTGWGAYDDFLSADPTDASAWTHAKVNAMEFGAEVRP